MIKHLRIFIVALLLIGCSPYIEQDVDFKGYDDNCEKLFYIKTYVWGYRSWYDIGGFIQKLYFAEVEEGDVEEEKSRQMSMAEDALRKLNLCVNLNKKHQKLSDLFMNTEDMPALTITDENIKQQKDSYYIMIDNGTEVEVPDNTILADASHMFQDSDGSAPLAPFHNVVVTSDEIKEIGLNLDGKDYVWADGYWTPKAQPPKLNLPDDPELEDKILRMTLSTIDLGYLTCVAGESLEEVKNTVKKSFKNKEAL